MFSVVVVLVVFRRRCRLRSRRVILVLLFRARLRSCALLFALGLLSLRFLSLRLRTLLLHALRCLALLRHRALLRRLTIDLWRTLRLHGGLRSRC